MFGLQGPELLVLFCLLPIIALVALPFVANRVKRWWKN
jgi:hypothetical protein